MTNSPPSPTILAQTDWDAIIIGTGIGGGVAGRALAEAGLRVLFLEMGHEGYRTETNAMDLSPALPMARAARGLWPEPISLTLNGRTEEVIAPLGSGLGGSSVFYAATLERPERHDLDTLPDRPHPTGGWPVSFDMMRPWYDRAATLFHLSGSPDPLSAEPYEGLRPGLEISAGDRAIMERLTARGLHPYQLHASLKPTPNPCGCLGQKCACGAKMDGRSAGVEPALATGNAALLCEARVERLTQTGSDIREVSVIHRRARLTFRARHIVLAAGALASPGVLLASHCEAAPRGIGNAQDQVGRHLMFHLNELFALWPGRRFAGSGPSKSVGFRDFYFHQGTRLGMVQAMGIDIGYGEILHHLRGQIARGHWRHLPGAHAFARLPAAIAAKLMGKAKTFVGLLEDLPLPENRVRFDPARPGKLIAEYRVSDELKSRRRLFRRAIKSGLKGQRIAFLNHVPEPNLGHPCGTLTMGDDPRRSVVNAQGRVHGMGNLWVTDASVFPSSMGVNPSLTIAANALRVAANISEKR